MNSRSTRSRIHRTGMPAVILLTALLCAPAALMAADGEDTVDKLQEQAEAAAEALGMVAFAGIGEVAPELSDMNTDNILHSLGGGIRFRASEEQRVNLSIDYAVGMDSDAWYFRIGEAF